MQKILLIASGTVHPPFMAVRQLSKTLQIPRRFSITRARSLERLPAEFDHFDAAILYFHRKEISQNALNKLRNYVSKGGGLLGVHSATASFKEEDQFFDLLGGRFSHHGAVEPITIHPSGKSEVFTLEESFSIRDELYYHDLKEDLTVHYSTAVQGEEIPVVWTRQFGAGRVCYAMPGHTLSSMKHPLVQAIIHQALDWVSTK